MKTKYQRHCLTIAIFIFALIVFSLGLLFFYGCTHKVNIPAPSCTHKAIVCAMKAIEQGYPTRIWIGRAKPEYQKLPYGLIQFHVQAQAELSPDDWYWLDLEDMNSRPVESNKPNHWFIPTSYLTIDEYWQNWKRDWLN